MRYLTYDHEGQPRLGALKAGRVIDLAEASAGALPADLLGLIRAGPTVWEQARAVVEAADATSGRPLAETTLLAPIPRPVRNVFCLGRNYVEHALESARVSGGVQAPPAHPVYFTKATTAVTGPGATVPAHRALTRELDWEAELGVVIGVSGRDLRPERALDHVFGYTCVNDITARDLQAAHGQWFKGKSLDGTCPVGPWIVTADELPDAQQLELICRVNGVIKQRANTREMIFDIVAILVDLSRGLTLEPGDLISTGTPAGVGMARIPPEYLQPGDVVEVEIERIGVLRNVIV